MFKVVRKYSKFVRQKPFGKLGRNCLGNPEKNCFRNIKMLYIYILIMNMTDNLITHNLFKVEKCIRNL
jgi:hypothetical protein